ncbi:MAG: hydrogenase maturation nickel metallochaperone HypA [Bernardetiaceae bacterium]
MHELSIVLSIVDAVHVEVEKHQAKSVSEITLVIGALSGVDPQALDFAWEVGVKNTPLEKATCHIQHTQAEATCADCGNRFAVRERYQSCPSCGSFWLQILGGDELKIQSLTLLN